MLQYDLVMTEAKPESGPNIETITQELRELEGKTDYKIGPLIQLMNVYRQKPNFVVPLLFTDFLVPNEKTKTLYTTMAYEDSLAVLDATVQPLQPDLKTELDKSVALSIKTVVDSLKNDKDLKTRSFAEEILFGDLGKILSEKYPEVRAILRKAFTKIAGDTSFEQSFKVGNDLERNQKWRLDFRVAQLFGEILGITDPKSVLPVASDRAEKEEMKKDEAGIERREKIRELVNSLDIRDAQIKKGILGDLALSLNPLANESNRSDIDTLAKLIAEDFSIFFLQKFDTTGGFIKGNLPSDLPSGSRNALYTVFDRYFVGLETQVASLQVDPLGKSLELRIPQPNETENTFRMSRHQSLREPKGGKVENLTDEEQTSLLKEYLERLSLFR